MFKETYLVANKKKSPEAIRQAGLRQRRRTNYRSAIVRIANAKTIEELNKVESGLDRVYNAGQLTTSELSRLSSHAMRRAVEIGNSTLKPFSRDARG